MNFKKPLLFALASVVMLSACKNNVSLSPQNLSQQNLQVGASSIQKYTVVEIRVKNKDDLVKLDAQGLDLFGANPRANTIKGRLTDEQIKFLKAEKFYYKEIPATNMAPTKGMPQGYRSYADMLKRMKELETKYPEIVSVTDIGDTWEKTQGKAPNNDIFCVTITNKSKKGVKPTSLFTGGIHAREIAPPEVMFNLIEELATNYGKDSKITEIVDTKEVNIVPVMNVDGRLQVEKGNTWQRKNTHGVDLNRNFDSHWNYQGLTGHYSVDSNPNSETYSGKSAASEPETQAIQNLYKAKKITMALDMHAYGDMFFWPVGYSEDPVPETATYKKIYEDTYKKVGYQGGTSMNLLYATTGSADDYAYVKGRAAGFGMEVGQDFRPSANELTQIWKDNKDNLLQLLKINSMSLQVTSSTFTK